MSNIKELAVDSLISVYYHEYVKHLPRGKLTALISHGEAFGLPCINVTHRTFVYSLDREEILGKLTASGSFAVCFPEVKHCTTSGLYLCRVR